jgi:hypothetical protein
MSTQLNTDDIWEAVHAAMDPKSDVAKARRARAAVEAKYLVNGALLLTEKQWAEVHRLADENPLHRTPHNDLGIGHAPGAIPRSLRLDSIKVKVIPDNGQPVDVGNDQQAFKHGDAIYVVSSTAIPELPPLPAAGFPARYPLLPTEGIVAPHPRPKGHDDG